VISRSRGRISLRLNRSRWTANGHGTVARCWDCAKGCGAESVQTRNLVRRARRAENHGGDSHRDSAGQNHCRRTANHIFVSQEQHRREEADLGHTEVQLRSAMKKPVGALKPQATSRTHGVQLKERTSLEQRAAAAIGATVQKAAEDHLTASHAEAIHVVEQRLASFFEARLRPVFLVGATSGCTGDISVEWTKALQVGHVVYRPGVRTSPSTPLGNFK
jgi:hypothetical protein